MHGYRYGFHPGGVGLKKNQTLVEYSHKSYATIVLAYVKEDKVLVKDFVAGLVFYL